MVNLKKDGKIATYVQISFGDNPYFWRGTRGKIITAKKCFYSKQIFLCYNITKEEIKLMNQNYSYIAVDNIVNLIEIIQQEESKHPYNIDHRGAKYLLNQTIRQLWLPINRMYLSVEAEKLFTSLGFKEEEIFLHFSRMKIINKTDKVQTVNLYKGASSKPHGKKSLKKGESFLLREVFHDDHIIPVTHIIEKLLTINEPNRENVFEVLRDISVCRMLKEEDRRLSRTKRPYDEKFIIEKLYYDKDIRIKNYQYPN